MINTCSVYISSLGLPKSHFYPKFHLISGKISEGLPSLRPDHCPLNVDRCPSRLESMKWMLAWCEDVYIYSDGVSWAIRWPLQPQLKLWLQYVNSLNDMDMLNSGEGLNKICWDACSGSPTLRWLAFNESSDVCYTICSLHFSLIQRWT